MHDVAHHRWWKQGGRGGGRGTGERKGGEEGGRGRRERKGGEEVGEGALGGHAPT